MWGTDAAAAVTVTEGTATISAAIDHRTALDRGSVYLSGDVQGAITFSA